MTPQIEQRIEQIQRGEVPEGYKKTKVGVVPSEWDVVKLSSISSHVTRKNTNGKVSITFTNSATQGVIKQTDYFDKEISNKENITGYYLVQKNDYIYNPRISVSAPCGPINKSHFEEEGVVSPLYTVFKMKDELQECRYLEFFFKSSLWYRYMCGVANYGARHDRMNITNEDLFGMPVLFPPLAEQEKIAKILSMQDKLIALKEKLIEEKKRQKKYTVHGILSQNITLQKQDGSKYPQWKTNNIGAYLTSRNTKQIPTEEAPLMAFVADVGVVQKGERYDRSFLVKSDEKEYKRTELNDFIYSSNNLDVGSIGLNNYGSAVISVVYEIFSVNSNAIPIVISEIIQMKSNINKILRYRQGALYGQYRIFAEDFLSVNIDVPSLEEQQAIAKIMLSFEKEIELLQQELEQHKQKKKALMQLLLTGIVRVNR